MQLGPQALTAAPSPERVQRVTPEEAPQEAQATRLLSPPAHVNVNHAAAAAADSAAVAC